MASDSSGRSANVAYVYECRPVLSDECAFFGLVWFYGPHTLALDKSVWSLESLKKSVEVAMAYMVDNCVSLRLSRGAGMQSENLTPVIIRKTKYDNI